MIIEFGNHDAVHPGPDDRPKVTTVHIPEFDEEFRKTKDHYGHEIGGLTVEEFKTHRADAIDYNQGITRLPGHEALLAITAAWPQRGRGRPKWVHVAGHDGLTPEGRADDIQSFLSEFYEAPSLEDHYKCDLDEAHVRKELEYWTKCGAPGEYFDGPAKLPDAQMTYMVDGRIMNNNNDGGDALQSVMMGTGTAATATTLTTGQTLVTNATAGHRVYVYTTSGTVFVWGNCISNTNAASASVITVDQWYVPLTPGGSAGATPGTPWSWVLVDGGMVSTWFAALATGANAPANTDHTLATNGNVEYPTAAGGLYRKICPTAVDVSASARTVTLVPVWTVNGSDTGLPRTLTVVGFFASMVPGFGGAGGPMKFETQFGTSAVVSAVNDQLTVTETISGS